jgi:hypothetical protein
MVRVRRLICSFPLSIAAIEPNRREAEGQVNRSDPALIQLLETAKHAHRMRQLLTNGHLRQGDNDVNGQEALINQDSPGRSCRCWSRRLGGAMCSSRGALSAPSL